jgi:hypothetical protein
MQILFTNIPEIRDSLITELELVNRGEHMYGSQTNTLMYAPSITEELIVASITAFNPIKIWILSTAHIIDNEHHDGDIVMPNVFLKYEPSIESVEFNEENRDSYLHDPLFLHHYSEQADVNFEIFGLSIGGICVTRREGMNAVEREQVEFAYQADCIDELSYDIIDCAKRLEKSEDVYPMLLMIPTATLDGEVAKFAKNIAPVLAYLQSNTSSNNVHDDA